MLLAFLLAQVAAAGLVFRFPPWPLMLLGCAAGVMVLRRTDRLWAAAVAAVLISVLLHTFAIGPNLLAQGSSAWPQG